MPTWNLDNLSVTVEFPELGGSACFWLLVRTARGRDPDHGPVTYVLSPSVETNRKESKCPTTGIGTGSPAHLGNW